MALLQLWVDVYRLFDWLAGSVPQTIKLTLLHIGINTSVPRCKTAVIHILLITTLHIRKYWMQAYPPPMSEVIFELNSHCVMDRAFAMKNGTYKRFHDDWHRFLNNPNCSLPFWDTCGPFPLDVVFLLYTPKLLCSTAVRQGYRCCIIYAYTPYPCPSCLSIKEYFQHYMHVLWVPQMAWCLHTQDHCKRGFFSSKYHNASELFAIYIF